MPRPGGGECSTRGDFLGWCRRLALAETTQSAIAEVRSRNPTRRVGGGRDNVSGRYPSRKMGLTIQFESHRVELPLVYEMEHDPDVLLDGATVPRLENLPANLPVLECSRFEPIRSVGAGTGAHRCRKGSVCPHRPIGAYRHTGVQANSGKFCSRLLMNPLRAPYRRLREVWANTERLYQADRKVCHRIAARSSAVRPESLLEEGREQSGSANLLGWRRFWCSRSSRTGRPRFIKWPRALDTRTTDTSTRSIRNCVGQSAKRLRWRSKTNQT